MTERIQLQRTKGWKMPPDTVNVARPGRWGNPFAVEAVGSPELAVEMFRDLMRGFFNPDKLRHLTDAKFRRVYKAKDAWQKRLNWGLEYRVGAAIELRGKNLACFCALDQPCHADVLLAIANATPGDRDG